MKRILTALALCLALLGFGAHGAAAAGTVLSGTFHVIEGRDYRSPTHLHQYLLETAPGQFVPLEVDDALFEMRGGHALDGQPVTVTLASQAAAEARPVRNIVTTQALNPTPEPEAVTGSQPFAWVLCQFPGDDSGTSETRAVNYFQGMYSASYPGLDHYWRQVSYNTINIAGSAVVADGSSWLTMPHSQSHYMDGDNPRLNLIYSDCVAAAQAAGQSLSGFTGINLILDETIGCCAWGGGGVTWEPPWAWQSITVFSHEMGHAFGLPHSNAKRNASETNPYDNPWDVMSGAYTYALSDATYGRVGLETNAFHKDALGWMTGRKLTFTGGAQSVQLEALTHQSGGTKMIQIPGNNPNHFYTVEARQPVGYDGAIPESAVIIYEVDRARSPEPAWIQGQGAYVDPDGADVRWTPGETWTSPQGVRVEVQGAYAQGFTVCVAEAGAACGLFADVPSELPAPFMEDWVLAFYNSGLTTGCAVDPLRYCPGDPVTRGAMAVFLLRAMSYPGDHTPAGDPAQIFADVPSPNQPPAFELWIEDFYAEGITTGCAADPLRYCPEAPVTRGEMAVFILRALEGPGYVPAGNSGQTFNDVPSPNQPPVFEAFIEEFANRGITTGCDAAGNFCPEAPVTRAAMAVFILRAFDAIPDPDDP